MFGFSELELIMILAFCVGLLAVLEDWIRPNTLVGFTLAAVIVTLAGRLSHYKAIRTFEDTGGVHYRWYLAGASIAFAVAAFAVFMRATGPHSRILRALLKWAMTPLFLAVLSWLGATFSSYWLEDSTDLISMAFVTVAIGVASLAACSYEQLEKPTALDHIRQAGLLYLSLFLIGRTHHGDLFVGPPQDLILLDREWLMITGIILNAAVLVFWRQLHPDHALAV